MKRAFLLSVAVVGMLVFGVPAHAQSGVEQIDRFDMVAQVQTDATVNVVETLRYDFGSAQHHGIYRDIPVSYTTSAGKTSIGIDAVRVTDETGAVYPFTTERFGPNLRIKIGDPNALVTGTKTYVISYRVSRAIGYFGSYDEFYWNVTGSGWSIPIDEASAVINIPTSFPKDDLRVSCYEGAQGSTQKCTAAMLIVNGSSGSVKFEATDALAPSQQLTVALGFPKGLVSQPSSWESLLQTIRDNIVLGLPVVVFVGMLLLWFYKGRDPRGRGTVVPEYDSPDDLTPLEQSVVLNERFSNTAVSSEIIYLATKGYLKITRLNEKILFFNHTDYQLDKLQEGADIPEFDRLLLNGLFATGSSVKLSDLRDHFYKELPIIKNATMVSVVAKKYFTQSPEGVRGTYTAVGIGIMAICSFVGSSLGSLVVISGTISGLIVVLFGYLMPRVTKEGAIVRERIEGLKWYMNVAEKDRINFHDAPEKSPALFEKLLPFAMALGVENAWAKQFEGIYNQPPAWYADSRGGTFNPVFFTTDLRSFSTGATSTLASAPGGGSGSGGGGFSGGGFGGGGGGSW